LNPERRTQPTGSDIHGFSRVESLPELRPVASLALTHSGLQGQSALNIGSGAYIHTDPGGSVQLSTTASMYIDGKIEAPAGSIPLTLPAVRGEGYHSDQSIWLGPHAALATTGAVKLVPDPLGRRTGNVLDGGAVTITADHGYVVSEAGSSIDVSGVQADL